jgi:hypothetical protein
MRLVKPIITAIYVVALLVLFQPAFASQDIRLWQYKDYTNTATGHRVHYASKVTYGFTETANGRAGGRITLGSALDRTTVEFDILQSSPSQVLDCTEDCTVTAKFDSDSPVTINAKRLKEGTYAVILENPVDLIEKIKRSNSLVITTALKNDGDHEFAFRIEGLEWPRSDK